MGFNLGESIQEFREEWEDSYLMKKDKCKHHGLRYEQGWIPLACVPYSPALNRFNPETELSKKIVNTLEDKGEFIFKEHGYFSIDKIEKSLEEIMLYVPREIILLIADYGAGPLMLDRKAFAFSEGSPNEYNLQWYISRCESKQTIPLPLQ